MVRGQVAEKPPRMGQPTVDPKPRRFFIWIIVLSILLRVGAALYLGDTVPPAKDEMSYSVLAERLATGHGYSFPSPWYPFAKANAPTSHWSFLYTAFVAGVYAIVGPHPLAARLVQAVAAGVLMPWFTWRLARRMEKGRRRPSRRRKKEETIPLIAAGLSAVYAYFVLYGAMVQTEAFFICALLWSLERGLAVADRMEAPFGCAPSGRSAQDASSGSAQDASWTGLSFGLSLGVATLLRQSILPWVAVMFGYLGIRWLTRRREGAKIIQLAPLVVAGVVMVGCIVPFTVRNLIAYDNFLLLNSNAGYAMYSAQHPAHGTSFQEYWAAPLPDDLAGQGLNEAEWDDALMARGIGFVLAEPGRYLMLSLSRVRDYIEFWPTPDSSALFNIGRVLSIGIFLPFMLYGIWMALSEGRRKKEEGRSSAIFHFPPSLFLLGFMAFYSLLHIFTWAMSRYRLPVDAVALVFAAVAIYRLMEKGRRKAAAELPKENPD